MSISYFALSISMKKIAAVWWSDRRFSVYKKKERFYRKYKRFYIFYIEIESIRTLDIRNSHYCMTLKTLCNNQYSYNKNIQIHTRD